MRFSLHRGSHKPAEGLLSSSCAPPGREKLGAAADPGYVAKSLQARRRLARLQKDAQLEPPVLMHVRFGPNAEYGSVTFRREGGKTEVLELIEPEPLPEEP